MRNLIALSGLLMFSLQVGEPDLKTERLRTRTGTPFGMFVAIAQNEDGTPAIGNIACSGDWYKYVDSKEKIPAQWALPFRTDSRGAAVFNPWYDDDYYLTCWAASDKGKTGRLYFMLEPGATQYIVVKKE